MNIYLIILLAIAVPALYGIREYVRVNRSRKKQLKLAQAYDRLVFENKLSVEYIDIIKDKVIAIDRINKKMLLIVHTTDSEQELCIPLLQVTSCRIVEERDEQDESINRIYLEIKQRRHLNIVSFCFYDKGKDSIKELPSLSRKAGHWNHRVNIHKHPGSISIEQEYVL